MVSVKQIKVIKIHKTLTKDKTMFWIDIIDSFLGRIVLENINLRIIHTCNLLFLI